MDDIYQTFLRLSSRLDDAVRIQYQPMGVNTSLEEQCMAIATLLGAKDPYLVVLYPDYLERILTNTQPDWMESHTAPDIELREPDTNLR